MHVRCPTCCRNVKRRRVSSIVQLAQKYNYPEITADIQQLLADKKVRFPMYHRASRTRQVNRQEAVIKHDFLVVEGTPALVLPALNEIPAVRIHVSADNHEREQLLLADWMERKGLSYQRAYELLAYRRQREEPFIIQGLSQADVHIQRVADHYTVSLR